MFFVTVIPHAAVVHNFNTTEPVPVTDNVTEHFVVAIITNVLNDLNSTVSVFHFLYRFFVFLSIASLKQVMSSLTILTEVFKPFIFSLLNSLQH